MQVSVTTLEGLERKMTVKVPAENLRQEIEKRLRSLMPKVRIDGFRPGKVPEAVVRQRFGDALRSEVVSDLIQSTFGDALQQEKLSPAGLPRIEITSPQDEQLEYQAIFEVYPEITLQPLDQVELEQYQADISEAAIDEVMDKLRRQQADWEEVNRTTQKGDRITLDFESRIHNETFEGGSGKGVRLDLGEGSAIPDFEQQLIGVKPHTPLDFTIRFPDNYHRKELAGKSAMVHATVNQVQEARLPELDDEFAQKFGVAGGVAQLREDAQKNMQRELERVTRNHLKSQILEKLLELHPVAVPQTLVDSELKNLQQQAEQYKQRGVNKEVNEEQYRKLAERRVRLGLLFAEFIRQHQIKIDPERVQTLLTNMAAPYDDPHNVIAWYQSDKNRMRQLETMAMEEQVIDGLIGQAKLVPKPISYGEAIRQPQQEEEL